MFVINKKIGILKIQKVFYVFVMLLLSKMSAAQNGMNFQGVARNTSGIILASQPIAVRLSILQGTANGTVLYQETKTVTTNAQGIFNIVIGDPAGATSTTGSYNNIAWQTPPHFIRLEMDPSAGTNFATLGTTQLQFVAYAQFANAVAADNIVGLVPVARGGTGASTLQDLKQNLQLNNVNNTSDLNKPISTATQTALNEKASLTNSHFLSDIKVNGLTVGRGNGNVLSNIALGDFALNSDSASVGENNIGIGVQTLRYNNGGTRNVAVGSRALYSNGNSSKMTAIGVNADVLNPGLSLSNSTALGFGAIVDESNLIQLGNSDIQKVITSGVVTAAGFKIPAGTGNDVLLANGTTLNTSVLELNNNKSTDILLGGTSPSDVLYPSQKAVKAYVSANSASGSIADGGITTIKLADGAVTDAKVTSISGAKITGATTANISPSTNRNYVTDIQAGVISNTSGINTGDETTATIKSKLGITTFSGSNTGDQTITLTGDITGSGAGTFTSTLSNTGVTAGTYGSSSVVPVLTIDAKGRVTNITTNAVSGGGSSDAATLTGNTLASNIIISSLTGVGTITSGTWSGSTIAIAKGGTGATTALAARNNLGIGTPTIAGQNNDQQQVLLGDVTTGELLYKDLYDINPTLFDDKASLTASQNNFTGDIKAKTYILTNPSSTTVSTATTNINLATGNVLELVLTANTTLSFSNPRTGTYIIKIKQDATGGRVVTFPTMKWSDDIVPVITATANRTDLLTLIYDGTNYYATCLQNF